MKIKVTKAVAFEIDPAKKYVCVVVGGDLEKWNEAQKAEFTNALQAQNMAVAFLPAGSKFKIMEQPNDGAKTGNATPAKA